ncbi:P-loop NTPase [Desulfurivibrio sp. D14AmB]|uniref:P-loop NTPase n=1 Tax=Desulfurivibrio sp. D14AmB TaxID=3374370 RepID=UPI00376F247F
MVTPPGRPRIIPIASGKGGVGKSIFAASLAISLARRGETTVAVDLDLGGSNLHTYLGMPNTNPGVGDFLKRRLTNLSDLVVPTPVDNLGFLPGDGKTPFMANISTRQRLQLLDELLRLKARYIIIDLGAGSAINTMNLFGLALDGIVITTLDTPALMNALVFLRNFTFANILSLASERAPTRKMLLDAYRRSADGANLTAEEIYGLLAAHDPLLARQIRQRLERFTPRFVYNMADQPEDLRVAGRIQGTLKQNLSMNSSPLGLLFHDPAVRKSVRQNKVFLREQPDTPYARGLRAITDRLLKAAAPSPSLETLIGEARRHA